MRISHFQHNNNMMIVILIAIVVHIARKNSSSSSNNKNTVFTDTICITILSGPQLTRKGKKVKLLIEESND